MTPAETAWTELRKRNPALLPWAKLTAEVRHIYELAERTGCACGYCERPRPPNRPAKEGGTE